MEQRHAGKVAVVTGAASGIGQAHALRLAAEGAAVIVADVQPGDATLGQIEASGGRAAAIRCDVADPDSVAAFGDRVEVAFGRCDILVNNAGLIPAQSVEHITFAEWRRIMSVNLDGVFLMTQRFLPGMRERKWGRIVNMASNTFGQKTKGLAHYVASKGGVIGFTRSLAAEVGVSGVTVNAIAPGLVRTHTTESGPQAALFDMLAQQQAIKRTQEPADLVGALSFFASDDSAFITGQTLCVDGGWMRA